MMLNLHSSISNQTHSFMKNLGVWGNTVSYVISSIPDSLSNTEKRWRRKVLQANYSGAHTIKKGESLEWLEYLEWFENWE